MERWRVCPECGSENIYCDIGMTPKLSSKHDSAASANTIIVEDGFPRPEVANIDVFVCADCYNIRSYVSEDEVIEKIMRTWRRADTLVDDEHGEYVIRRVMSRKRRRGETERG